MMNIMSVEPCGRHHDGVYIYVHNMTSITHYRHDAIGNVDDVVIGISRFDDDYEVVERSN